MRYSELFPKSRKQEFKEDLSINAKLLTKAGFIDQLMAGSYTLLPLGLRVVEKIKDIIREELNSTGAQELSMPLLHPKEIWDQTGRWADPKVKEIMYQFSDIHKREFGLSFTHEEIVMNLLGKFVQSYKDLPVKVYQFSTKFRNEPRAKSGILRGREFLMKDLYSAHLTEEDMYEYYNKIKKVYVDIFKRMGLDVKVVEAGGGVFTDKNSHEFQVLSEIGEDTIYYCSCNKKECDCNFAQNEEIFNKSEKSKCPNCDDNCEIKKAKAIEVGNIFPLGTKYSEKMGVFYTDKDGREKPIWFASYGIGPTRIMGALAETYHDERGMRWPKTVAPFNVHLVHIEDPGTESAAKKVYEALEKAGIEVLWDDRENTSAGEKFNDADLIGIPIRLVVSAKTGDKVELKERSSKETEFLNIEEVISRTAEEKES